ncbi:BrnT family toxin [Sphingomonas sp. RP10(2022)]|uniref:BrnT family toxin n=1 Tax=Sphingomonas liriopis TaxID=2949094 RepID=A0A9X2HTR5_9SPHN|nr:BrnT family toxin [Sphingomonas liriopis]MCP3735727.1 BrnT family toxin [Sphingomonas liriopis]
MDITFDPAKDVINRAKHGVSLAFGEQIWADDAVVIVPTIRVEDGERRFRAIGIVDGRLWTAVHVYRDRTVRMISVRRSNDGERRIYDSN